MTSERISPKFLPSSRPRELLESLSDGESVSYLTRELDDAPSDGSPSVRYGIVSGPFTRSLELLGDAHRRISTSLDHAMRYEGYAVDVYMRVGTILEHHRLDADGNGHLLRIYNPADGEWSDV